MIIVQLSTSRQLRDVDNCTIERLPTAASAVQSETGPIEEDHPRDYAREQP